VSRGTDFPVNVGYYFSWCHGALVPPSLGALIFRALGIWFPRSCFPVPLGTDFSVIVGYILLSLMPWDPGSPMPWIADFPCRGALVPPGALSPCPGALAFHRCRVVLVFLVPRCPGFTCQDPDFSCREALAPPEPFPVAVPWDPGLSSAMGHGFPWCRGILVSLVPWDPDFSGAMGPWFPWCPVGSWFPWCCGALVSLVLWDPGFPGAVGPWFPWCHGALVSLVPWGPGFPGAVGSWFPWCRGALVSLVPWGPGFPGAMRLWFPRCCIPWFLGALGPSPDPQMIT
jgi:hypothetical protein